jgi:hypothetical protein
MYQERILHPTFFSSASATNFYITNLIATSADVTNLYLTTVEVLSVFNNPIIGVGLIGENYVFTNILTANTITVSGVIYTTEGNSNQWNLTNSLALELSTSFLNLPQIVPTITSYLTTGLVNIDYLDVREELLSSGTSLFDIFSTTDNQNLTFNNATYNLSIERGNSVNLGALNTIFAANSSKYENLNTVVQNNSASWEESNTIIPTVVNHLSTNKIEISALAVPTFEVILTGSPNLTFGNDDSGKVFHVNTAFIPVTAYFSSSLKDGFNVGINNIGFGLIEIKSDFTPIINATGTFNSVQNTGMFIYKANNQLYGIGVFE